MRYLCAAFTSVMMLLSSDSGALSQSKPYRGAEYRTLGTMLYGRFEVRMRSAQASGMLSSFFTYYDPANPWNEIDIEAMGRYSNETQFNTIVPTQANNHVQRHPLAFNPHAAFHVYAIEWTPDYVAWQVDGVEVYRQTGAHITQMNKPQKLMMNIWQPNDVGWAGSFNPTQLPLYAYYDWVKYYSYTPGTGDNFTLLWKDDFDAFNELRWQKATHTWDGNNSQFVQDNVVFKDGYMILCLTDNQHSGYSGVPVVDTDIDAPYLISARASSQQIRVLFSETLDKASAQSLGNYIVPGVSIQGASLLSDSRTVQLDMTGLNSAESKSIIALGVKDTSGNTMGAKSIAVTMPLRVPIKIDVGGAGSSGYLGDSVWNFSRQYGAVGGSRVQQEATVDIAGTTEDSVYRSALEGLSFYRIRVAPDMTHTVSLLFSEPKYQAAGQRVFDVKLNGAQTMRVDIYQQAGSNTSWTGVFQNVAATDGTIELYFAPSVDKPILSGIIIESIASDVNDGNLDNFPSGYGFDVFPNPFNGTTNFVVSLPLGGDVEIEVFDVLGKSISEVSLGYQERGEHSFLWGNERLATGTYFCVLSVGGQHVTRRILYIK